MNETNELWRDVRRAKQERNAAFAVTNTQAIDAAGIRYETRNGGECLLIREAGMPKVDFYPSTGRWRANCRTYNGGAKRFLAWWRGVVENVERAKP